MSGVVRLADNERVIAKVREVPGTDIRARRGRFRISYSDQAETTHLFQPGLAHAVEEFRHRTRRIGDVFFNPGNRDIRLQHLELLECRARLRKLSGLREARTINPMTAGKSRSVLNGLATEGDRFGVVARQVICRGQAHKEYCVLRIVRTRADRLFQMRDRSIRLAIKRKGPAEITVSGGEIRVEIDGSLKLLDRLLGVTPCEGHVAERETS